MVTYYKKDIEVIVRLFKFVRSMWSQRGICRPFCHEDVVAFAAISQKIGVDLEITAVVMAGLSIRNGEGRRE
jgi:hypothetical protein